MRRRRRDVLVREPRCVRLCAPQAVLSSSTSATLTTVLDKLAVEVEAAAGAQAVKAARQPPSLVARSPPVSHYVFMCATFTT